MSTPPVILDGNTCTIEDIRRIALHDARVSVPDANWQRVAEARVVVERVLASGQPIYGLNTGLGSLKKFILSDADIEAFNDDVIISHSVPLDTPPLGVPNVRAMMATRINGIVRGGTGVRPEALHMLVDLLNRGVHPIVHGWCVSVGESDMSPLAEIVLVMTGRGRAIYNGQVLSGADVLEQVGLQPLTLHAKEGLGLISANAQSVGSGAIALSEAWRLVVGFEHAAALSLEAFRANVSILHAPSLAARVFPGQQQTGRNLRTLLQGSDLFKPGVSRNLQDPLSFRCVAQVHGTVRDGLAYVQQIVENMLNSSVDSPLTLIEENRMLTTGNFESTSLSLAFDHLRLTLHRLILMSIQRLDKLLWHEFSGLPSALNDATDGSQRLGMLYNNISRAAAALAAQAQTTAVPASLSYTPQITEGIDDYASMAPVSLDRTWDMLWIAFRSIIMELLVSSRAICVLERAGRLHTMGKGTARLNEWLQAKKTQHALESGGGSLERLIADFDLEAMINTVGLIPPSH